MSRRWKLIGTGILLCIALGLVVFFAVQFVRAVARFQQSRQLALSGDVRTIRPWMTLSYIARVYHVPESDLLQALQLSDSRSVHRATLYALAARLHVTPDALIQKLQTAILAYRHQHPSQPQAGAPHSAIPPPLRRQMTA